MPWESAGATASFTVKAFEPPTISLLGQPQQPQSGRQERHPPARPGEPAEPPAHL